MSRYCLLIFLGFLLITACKSAVKKRIPADSVAISAIVTKKTDNKPDYNNPLLKEYNSFLIKQDTTSIESSTVSANKFIELFKNQDRSTCDTAFLLFNEFYGRLTKSIDELHNKDTTIQYDSLLTDSTNIYRTKLSEKSTIYAQKLKDNGLMVYMSEGDTYIGQDMDFVKKWFYTYVSPTMKEYLVQINKENKEGFSEDAALIVSPRQFVDRTVWWEEFISKNPHCIVSGNAESNWKNYLASLLQGMDNTPVKDFGSITDSVGS